MFDSKAKATSMTRPLAPEVTVKTEPNADVIKKAAAIFAMKVACSSPSLDNPEVQKAVEEGFAWALEVVSAVDAGAKPPYDPVPLVLNDFVKSLNCFYRNTPIKVEPASIPKRPDSYDYFLNVCAALQLPCGKLYRVNPQEPTNVLSIREIEVNGTTMLAGVGVDVDLGDLVTRALVKMTVEDQEKLNRVFGDIDELYLSRDELIRQWASSISVSPR